MKLDKKQIWAIFLFKFKMGHKAVETAHNINCAFCSGTANELTVQWWFKFCKGDESLEVEAHSGWPLGVDNDNWEPSSKMILLQLHEKLRKNSTSTTLQLFSIWSKLESLRSSIIGCLMSWPEIKKKKIILKCHLSLFNTIQWAISGSDCDMWQKVDCVWQPEMTSSVAGLRRSSKALPKARLTPNDHGHSLVVCCWSTAGGPPQPAEPR